MRQSLIKHLCLIQDVAQFFNFPNWALMFDQGSNSLSKRKQIGNELPHKRFKPLLNILKRQHSSTSKQEQVLWTLFIPNYAPFQMNPLIKKSNPQLNTYAWLGMSKKISTSLIEHFFKKCLIGEVEKLSNIPNQA